MSFSATEIIEYAKLNRPDIEIQVESEEDLFLIFTETGSRFAIGRVGDSAQVAGYLFDNISSLSQKKLSALSRFLLTLNRRFLGCRFAYSDFDQLVIVSDIFSYAVCPGNIFEICDQMQYVSETLWGSIETVMKTGSIPSDDTIDSLFEVND